MRLFQEILLAETCYLEEVVRWIAFGRPPEFQGNEDGEESRRYGEVERTGYPPQIYWGPDLGFRYSEFALCGVDIDFERYQTARELYRGMSGTEYLSYQTRWLDESFGEKEATSSLIDPFSGDEFPAPARSVQTFQRTEEQIAQLRGEIEAEYRKDILEADWVIEQERKLDPVLDRAKARVFLALSSGEIKAEGWRAHPEGPGTKSEEWEEGSFEIIPYAFWTLDGCDWTSSALITPTASFTAVQVETEDMFKLFPTPNIEPVPLRMNKHGEAILLVEDASFDEPLKKTTRGRPPMMVAVKEAVTNYLVERLKKADAPSKLDALLQEAEDFAANILNTPIKRTTVQNCLNDARKAIPSSPPFALKKEMPLIHANN